MGNEIYNSNEASIVLAEQEVQVARYLRLRLSVNPETGRRYSKEDIAKEFGITRQTLATWVSDWERQGLLDKVSVELVRQLQNDKIDAMRIASAALPDIIAKQVDDALNAKYANHRNAAAHFIMEFLQMTNALELQDSVDEGENSYLGSKPELENPRSIARGNLIVQFMIKGGDDEEQHRPKIIDMPTY